MANEEHFNLKYILVITLAIIVSCKQNPVLPSIKPRWIFVLAGQSNMAGRGVVEPEDTLTRPDILMLDSLDQWVPAKEPLHYYEPSRRGLDCGLAFGRELMRLNGDSIIIGLVPCAVGGSSVEQWLHDDIHRDVRLFTNFRHKLEKARSFGIIKGILWHQGEANTDSLSLLTYSTMLDSLFGLMRQEARQPDLPIIMGELGEFLPFSQFNGGQFKLNRILHQKDSMTDNLLLVSSQGLQHKGDTIHFNSESLRELGKRYARAFMH